MDSIFQLDIGLFEVINGGWSSPFLDAILVPIRHKAFWIPFYVFVLSFIYFNRKLIPLISIVFLIGTVGLTDHMSSQVIKKSVERPRPCHEASGLDVNIKVRCGGGFSFTSSHATNHFGVATFLFLLFGFAKLRWRTLLFLWAGLVSIAQVYVGVHYPLDILCGAALGSLLAMVTFSIYKIIYKQFFFQKITT